jgi:hypothetical protein
MRGGVNLSRITEGNVELEADARGFTRISTRSSRPRNCLYRIAHLRYLVVVAVSRTTSRGWFDRDPRHRSP